MERFIFISIICVLIILGFTLNRNTDRDPGAGINSVVEGVRGHVPNFVKEGGELAAETVVGLLKADPTPPKPPVRVALDNPSDAVWKLYGPRGTGTAFVIGRDAAGNVLLVSAAHCLQHEGDYELGGGVFGEAVRFRGVRVIGRDDQNDVALLSVPNVKPYREISINQWRAGLEGEPVFMAGYGRGKWSHHLTTLLRTERLDQEVLEQEGLTPEIWVTEQVAEPGHSGSPVIDGQERLVGVLCATGGGVSACVHARYVRWLLEKYGYEDLIDRRVPQDGKAIEDQPAAVAQN